MIIEKKIPSKDIIQILKKEIKEFAFDHVKNTPASKITKSVFDTVTKTIPTNNIDVVYQYSRTNILMNDRRYSDNLKNVIKLLNVDECTNCQFYPKNSFMDWHTNSDNLGIRTYIIYTKVPGIFRYLDPKTNKIIDDEDYVGWTQRTFQVTENPKLWHCVWSPAPRFSYGFNKECQ